MAGLSIVSGSEVTSTLVATITDRYNIQTAPNGGYITSLAGQAALRSGLTKYKDLQAISGHFHAMFDLKRSEHASFEVERIGNSKSLLVRMRQVSSDPRQREQQVEQNEEPTPIATFLITVGDTAREGGRGPTRISCSAPDLPAPEDCVEVPPRMNEYALMMDPDGPGLPIANEIDYRIAKDSPWATGVLQGKSGGEAWSVSDCRCRRRRRRRLRVYLTPTPNTGGLAPLCRRRRETRTNRCFASFLPRLLPTTRTQLCARGLGTDRFVRSTLPCGPSQHRELYQR